MVKNKIIQIVRNFVFGSKPKVTTTNRNISHLPKFIHSFVRPLICLNSISIPCSIRTFISYHSHKYYFFSFYFSCLLFEFQVLPLKNHLISKKFQYSIQSIQLNRIVIRALLHHNIQQCPATMQSKLIYMFQI